MCHCERSEAISKVQLLSTVEIASLRFAQGRLLLRSSQ
jgi:hypothetical protein